MKVRREARATQARTLYPYTTLLRSLLAAHLHFMMDTNTDSSTSLTNNSLSTGNVSPAAGRLHMWPLCMDVMRRGVRLVVFLDLTETVSSLDGGAPKASDTHRFWFITLKLSLIIKINDLWRHHMIRSAHLPVSFIPLLFPSYTLKTVVLLEFFSEESSSV